MDLIQENLIKYKKALIIIVVGLIFSLSGVFIYGTGFSYEVVLDDQVLAYVDNEAIVESVINELSANLIEEHGESAYIANDIVVNKVRGFMDEEVDEFVFYNKLLDEAIVYKEATVLVIDGLQVVALESEDSVNNVLDALLAPYKGDAINVGFKQEVKTLLKDVRLEEVLDEELAILALSGDASDDLTKVRTINSTNDLSEAQLDVVSNVELVETEDIAFKTVEEKDSSMYSGQKKVVQKGVKGKKEFTYNAKYLNNVLESKELLSEKVISEPSDAIVKVGTKQYSYSAGKVANANIQAVLDEARRHVGVTRYRFGGTNPATGFDCSGFTQWVFAAGGYSIPRTSNGQAATGRSVSKSELQPGDLVFFLNENKTAIGHVGVYVGGGRFIHAANESHPVRYDSMNLSYYTQRFHGAKRVY